jgi:SAM-dependent methyltransferase
LSIIKAYVIIKDINEHKLLKIMNYNKELWNEYTDDNAKNYFNEVYSLFYHLSLSLNAKKICEAGCNIGNNLSKFTNDFQVSGFDMNQYALEKAQKRYPNYTFKQGSLTEIPFEDNEFDLVFTRGVLIHIHPDDIDKAINELYRVSKKWIFNLEYFGEDGKMINWKRGDDLLWYRNMKEKWSNYNVEIISDVEIPKEIDSTKSRLTLIKKL